MQCSWEFAQFKDFPIGQYLKIKILTKSLVIGLATFSHGIFTFIA